MIKAKTFLHALETLCVDYKKGKSYLRDKRLSLAEKKVIEAFFLIKKGDCRQAIIDLVETRSSDVFVQSQINLFLGVAYSNTAQFAEAELKLKSAYTIIEELELPRLKFIALNSLFFLYFNQQSNALMKSTLDEMKKFVKDPLSQLAHLRAEFNYHSRMEEFSKAEAALQKIEKLQDQMSEAQKVSFQIDLFMFFVKVDALDKCQAILEDLKFKRSFNSTANFNFMRILLDHLMHNRPLYINPQDFKEAPLLYQQLLVLKNLEESNLVDARAAWKELVRLNPEAHAEEEFCYKGDKSLFSLGLEKHRHVVTKKTIRVSVGEAKSLEDKLETLLMTSNIPINKEEIYQTLWGRPANSKTDFNKLSQLIVSLKAKKGLNIKYKKSCYSLVKETEEAA